MAIARANIDEPPYDTNGNGTPVIGMMPKLMPMFSNAWNPIHDATPAAASRPKGSAVRLAMRSARHTIVPSNTTINPEPRKPNSSPATEKMKSVCCSGTKRPVV